MAVLCARGRPAARAQGIPRAPLSNPDSAPALAPWPIRDMDKDRVPLDMVLAYAAQPQRDGDADLGARAEAVDEKPIRAAASGLTRSIVLRESNGSNGKKGSARAPAAVPVARVKVVVQAATAGIG